MIIDEAITFDLNGHKIYALTVRCKITPQGFRRRNGQNRRMAES